MISAKRYWSDGKLVAGEQFGNAFDDIGNRTSTQTGGNEAGNMLHTALYTANDLNQYTGRTVPGFLDILGTATNTATVVVNSQLAYRHGSFYEQELPAQNAGAPIWESVTNHGVLGATDDIVSNVTGNVFLPKNPENYTYDKDGNMTGDGRFTNNWDGENRLTNITSLSGAATGSLVKLDIAYDYMGRRIQKIVSTNNGSWSASYTNKFIYDGWNVVAVLDGGNDLIRSFVWGTDLNGSPQGASGAGGLISMTIPSGQTDSGTYFYSYDGNGNVTTLVNAANGNVAAQYWHGPFGELVGESGPMATANCFLFSTKWLDRETQWYYYGLRYYGPNLARWLSRDPIEENGAINIYVFCSNDSIDKIDLLGLTCTEITRKNGTPLITFNDTNHWELTGVHFIEDGGGTALTVIKGIKAHWEANVFVGCNCGGGCPVIKNGVRIFDYKHNYDDDFYRGNEFYIYKAGDMAVNVPTFTSILGGVLKVVAAGVKIGLPKGATMAPADARRVADEINDAWPTAPTDGSWKTGKSPCN